MDSQRTPQITLYGNLGADPEIRTLPARIVTKEVYDPIVDDVVTRDFDQAERQIRTGSLAINAKDGDGEEITRWHRLVDFKEHLAGFHKGDRLRVRGWFRNRTFTKNGEEATIREVVVTAASLEKRKVRTEAAPAPEGDPEAAPKARGRRKAAKTRRAEPERPPFDDDDIPF